MRPPPATVSKGLSACFRTSTPRPKVQARLQAHGLSLVLFNARPGDWAAGERGLASLIDREDEFQHSIHEALERAQALGCPRVHVMAGLCTQVDPTPALARYQQRLAWAAEQAQGCGVTLMIEPINPRDMPGYLLQRQAQAHDLVQAIGSAHLQVQMDLYHCQITEGDVTMRLRQYLPTGRVGHLQIAAVPDRGEPDRGELSYGHVIDELTALRYGGWIGLEYRPRDAQPGGTSLGLRWLRALAQPITAPGSPDAD